MLREDWTGDKETAVPIATHIIEMREWLAKMTELVTKRSKSSSMIRMPRPGVFELHGDQVLVLLPVAANRLKLQWTGLYRVTRKVGAVSYEIEMRQEKKIYHVNLMKSGMSPLLNHLYRHYHWQIGNRPRGTCKRGE